MPSEHGPTREPLLKRMLFGGSSRDRREEKVLEYIIHRVNADARLHDVIREDYVRRNCSGAEIEQIISSPEFVEAARERLGESLRSEEFKL